ncbi:cytochrome P450 [Natronoglomus mannanivorans]|uniref:Cytochrome P450 n=1 Tax=Natronoglomus mannanivorans TaxID=2979990 RepID=A0AAP3E241_9EURY|nr:cytochrome P450 [Halobacteria archaeon AArc-xg1-1]
MAMHSSRERPTPPGPDGVPLLGNTHELARDTLGFYERVTAEYGDVVGISVGGDEGAIVTHPEYVERILVRDDDRYVKGGLIEDQLGDTFGNGMFMAAGEQWRTQRQVAQPAFYRERILEYGETVVDHAADVGWPHASVVDLTDELSALTLSVLTDALFGFDADADEAVVREAASAIGAKLDPSAPTAFLPTWVPTPRNLRFTRHISQLRERVDSRIADRRRQDPDQRGDDLLSLLVAATANGELDDQTLRDDMITFLFAGHETTSLGLTYALFLLATHPDEQRRLQAELDATIDGDRPTIDDLPALEFTDCVIDEALRLYPPVFTFFREPVEDVELGGYRLPAGTTISVPQWIVHRDERWWESPETFDPDRWTDDRDSERPEYAFYPFGGGPRHCIGMRLARLELRLALATLCSTYRFEAVTTDLDLATAANLRPAGPLEVRVRRR